MIKEEATNWMYETLPYLRRGNWLYKLICFLLGKRKKKLTYNEVFLLLYGINKKKLGEKESKIMALKKVISFYEDVNHKKPVKIN